MDRNSIIGFVLILLIMVGYFFITQDNVSDLEARKQREKDSIAKLDAAVKTDSGRKTDTLKTQTAQTAIAADSTDTAKKEVYTGPFGRFASGTEELVTIENDLIKVKLSTKGGHPYSVELKEYNRSIRTEKGGKSDQPVVLFEGAESKFNISFATADGFTDSTSRLYFTPSAKNVDATKDSGTVSLKVSLDENQYLEQVYWLKPGSYELFYTIRVKGLNKLISPNLRFLQFDWKVTMPLQEHDVEQERDVSTVYYREEGLSPDYISEKSYEEKKAETNLEWVAFKQKFFNSSLIGLGDVSFGGAKVSTQKSFESTHVKTATFSSIVSLTPNNEETLPMKFYFGPNKYNVLKKLDNEMDALVPMGWGIFGWIN
ncbi:MAG TPA: membrane protein insertase YidC, partial [Bacteroidia bacterium]|nr:membrane protein insertase YidC [Bacteroidia bacterium]